MFSHFGKPRKAQKHVQQLFPCCSRSCPLVVGLEEGSIVLGMSVVDLKHLDEVGSRRSGMIPCKLSIQIPFIIFKISKFK